MSTAVPAPLTLSGLRSAPGSPVPGRRGRPAAGTARGERFTGAPAPLDEDEPGGPGPRPDERHDEDHALLARICLGDQTAFAALFDRYGSSALGLAIKVCRDRSLAEDVVQEAFLSVWQKARNFDPQRGSVASYLLGAVHNKAVDAIRHEESVRRREDATVLGFCAESAGDEVLEAAWLGVRRKEILMAFDQLSPLQREALELAYFGGLTYTEVAEHLGCPVGTAKTRLRDGMIRLRGLLGHLREGTTP